MRRGFRKILGNPAGSAPPQEGGSGITIPAVDGKSTWVQNMIDYGSFWQNFTTLKSRFPFEGDVWYYDGAGSFYDTGDYLNDLSFITAANDLISTTYAPYLNDNGGTIPARRAFVHGLYNHYTRTGDENSRLAILSLLNNVYSISGYGNIPGHPYGTYGTAAGTLDLAFELTREKSYAIEWMVMIQYRLGQSMPTLLPTVVGQVQTYLRYLMDHDAPYIKPFMIGIMWGGLIDYYEATHDTNTRTILLNSIAWLKEHPNVWLSQYNSYKYLDREYLTETLITIPTMFQPAYDLNNLIAHGFAWAYKETGDIAWATHGDKVFKSGVENAFLGDPPSYSVGGKQYAQNYRYSFKYVSWREHGPVMGG